MTREEAIGHLKNIAIYSAQDGYTDEARQALDMAIKTLQEQPERPEQPESAKEYCAECDHIEMCQWYPYEGCEFRSLPSAQPEPNCSEFPNNSDTISRQAAIDAVKSYWKNEVDRIPKKSTDFDVFTQICDSILTHNANICKAIDKLPSAQPETFKEKLNEIASALSEKFAYMNTCLNERDIILGYLGVKRPCKTHCNTDCTNTKCESHPSSAQLKTGKWIPCDVDIRGMTNMFVCSKCGSFTSLPILKYANAMEYDFCPNCGAYMRGEKDE